MLNILSYYKLKHVKYGFNELVMAYIWIIWSSSCVRKFDTEENR